MCALFLTVPQKENVSKNALIASILRRGTNNIKLKRKFQKTKKKCMERVLIVE